MKSKKMPDMNLSIYSSGGSNLRGTITNGCLHLTSEIWGDDFDSEKHYVFTEEDTNKLFSIMELDEFVEACKKGHVLWLEHFLHENDIDYSGACI